MKKILALLLTLISLVTLVACGKEGHRLPYLSGEVIEKYENACLIEVTETGYGQLAIGDKVEVNTSIKDCPNYEVGDSLKVFFEAPITEGNPPQILHVFAIERVAYADVPPNPPEIVQIAGVIVEVHDGNYLIECEAGDGYQCGIADGTQISVSRNVEGDPNCSVGDRILVKFNGQFQETYPLGINSPIEIGKLELRLTDDTGNSIE